MWIAAKKDCGLWPHLFYLDSTTKITIIFDGGISLAGADHTAPARSLSAAPARPSSGAHAP